jgi:hypothetical protein
MKKHKCQSYTANFKLNAYTILLLNMQKNMAIEIPFEFIKFMRNIVNIPGRKRKKNFEGSLHQQLLQMIILMYNMKGNLQDIMISKQWVVRQ